MTRPFRAGHMAAVVAVLLTAQTARRLTHPRPRTFDLTSTCCPECSDAAEDTAPIDWREHGPGLGVPAHDRPHRAVPDDDPRPRTASPSASRRRPKSRGSEGLRVVQN